MRAGWLEAQRLSFCPELDEPQPAGDEALIEVLLAGVCSTDLELLRGYYPYCGVPGHEFVGRVIASLADASWVGRRVVGEINLACGQCAACRRGNPTHCEVRTVLGIVNRPGVFAERLCLPLRNLHLVPDGVPGRGPAEGLRCALGAPMGEQGAQHSDMPTAGKQLGQRVTDEALNR